MDQSSWCPRAISGSEVLFQMRSGLVPQTVSLTLGPIGLGHPRWGQTSFDVHVEAASSLVSSPGTWVAYSKAPCQHIPHPDTRLLRTTGQAGGEEAQPQALGLASLCWRKTRVERKGSGPGSVLSLTRSAGR